jgi:hypothetical protein
MENAKQLKRRNEQFNGVLEKRLLGYVLAATASSVAVLAFAEPSEAEVVYTPANQSIWTNGGILDLNNDGIADFRFRAFTYIGHTTCAISVFSGLYIRRASPSNAAGSFALPNSILIGNKLQAFNPGSSRFMAGWNSIRWICSTRPRSYRSGGPFANTTDRYLGLQFSIQGETHYGWARFNVTVDARTHNVSAILTGYAYETTPNAPIFTGKEFGNESRKNPKPGTQAAEQQLIPPASAATLGHLAAGAQGITAWRINKVAKQE